ncbi:amidohydrolase family protein [Halomarina salina]|uniref:Amidohydrolase family protein n=1 Tax=Halomarina salina TaxID=1872699 RepID=A0ABD5RVA4_9EURY|nr:amidohydrolase family protein [Halomarina salina]
MSGRTTGQHVEEGFNTETVIDTDFHLEIHSPEPLLPYIENKAVAEKMEWGMPKADLGGWVSNYSHETESSTITHGQPMNTEEMVTVMERMGLDSIVVIPGLVNLATGRYPEVKTELARAYNDYLLDKVIDVSEGIHGAIIAPQWDTNAAVEELDRVGTERGVVAAQAWYGPNKLIGGTEFDPVVEQLCSLDLPWLIHGAGFDKQFDVHGASKHSYVEAFALDWSHSAMLNQGNIIFSGMLDKYPDLQVVIQEAGISWIPFMALRCDEMYQNYPGDLQLTPRLMEMDQEYLDRMPSEYVFDNFYYNTQPIALPGGPKHAKAFLEMCHAEDTILFATDFPHHTLDTVDWVRDNPAIDQKLQRQLLSETASELFGIDV